MNPTATLDQLDPPAWGPPLQHLRPGHPLRATPLGAFTVDDLRVMIGQRISLTILVPLALSRLEDDVACEGLYFPGDLLAAVLRSPDAFWSANRPLLARLLRLQPAAHTSALSPSVALTRFDALAVLA